MSDEKRIRCAVVTVSDRCSAGEQEDRSGPALAKLLSDWGWPPEIYEVLPDDEDALAARLAAIADLGADLILTTGGTGFGPRDRTPEATRRVAHRLAPGIGEWIRSRTGAHTPEAYLSRGIAVLRAATLIINLPGSPRGACEGLESLRELLPHAVRVLRETPGTGNAHDTETTGGLP